MVFSIKIQYKHVKLKKMSEYFREKKFILMLIASFSFLRKFKT